MYLGMTQHFAIYTPRYVAHIPRTPRCYDFMCALKICSIIILDSSNMSCICQAKQSSMHALVARTHVITINMPHNHDVCMYLSYPWRLCGICMGGV